MLSSFNNKHIPLQLKIDSMHMSALDRWNKTSCHVDLSLLEALPKPISTKEQKQNEQFIRDALEAIKPLLRGIPNKDDEFAKWRNDLSVLIKTHIQNAPCLTSAEKDFMSNEQLFNISEAFIQQALADVPTLDFEAIGQGLRNLWIASLLQERQGYSVELTPSLYGYSMLYPLTDTLMDSNSLSSKDKQNFCKRLTDRLLHKAMSHQTPEEKDIYSMLDLVDKQYPPDEFPEVHESLLAIQKGQERSLMQQKNHRTPYLTDVLGISFSKGGTSVLADAYLVSGSLSHEQAQFAYEFGAVLQLCDDLQDVIADQKAGHMTLFSQSFKHTKFDPILIKMIQYTVELTHEKNVLNPIIQKNCLLLILGASLSTPSLMSWRLRWDFSKRMPIRLKVLKQIQRDFSKEFAQIRHQEASLKKMMPKTPNNFNEISKSYAVQMDSLTR